MAVKNRIRWEAKYSFVKFAVVHLRFITHDGAEEWKKTWTHIGRCIFLAQGRYVCHLRLIYNIISAIGHSLWKHSSWGTTAQVTAKRLCDHRASVSSLLELISGAYPSHPNRNANEGRRSVSRTPPPSGYPDRFSTVCKTSLLEEASIRYWFGEWPIAE